MKKAKRLDLAINLAPIDPFYKSMIGRSLKWATTVGRYIVIFTELVVIVSFAGRFTLDRQVTDLNQRIFQKENIIKSYGDTEARMRTTQAKLNQYQQITSQQPLLELFPQLSSITPNDVILTDLVIRVNRVSMGGIANSQNGLNLLISNVQLSPLLRNVSVDRIESAEDGQSGFVFRISAETGPEATPRPATRPQSTPTVPIDPLEAEGAAI